MKKNLRNLIVPVTFALLGVYAGACSSGSPPPGSVIVGGACQSDYDCVSGDFCDGQSGLCVQNGTSGVGTYCNDDRDCASGDFCDGSQGVCVTPVPGEAGTIAVGQECMYDEECQPGDACADNGLCVADPYGASSEDAGAECYEDADCQSNYCDETTDSCV